MTGNTIKKSTDIIYRNKRYSIEDNYSLHLPLNVAQMARESKDGASTNDSDNKNEGKEQNEDKKIYIFKKLKKNKGDKGRKMESSRNTKNITKNFCKAFITYLKSNKVSGAPRARIREGISTYQRLFERRKYNNKQIKKMIAHESLRDLFRMFLEKEAKNWISQSKITDKALHEEAISIYLNLFESMNLVDRGYDSDSSQSEDSDRQDSDHESE